MSGLKGKRDARFGSRRGGSVGEILVGKGKKKVGRLENGFFFTRPMVWDILIFFCEMGAFFVIDSLVFEENAVRKGKRLEFFTRLRI